MLLLSTLMLAQQADFRLMSFNIERGDLGNKKGRGWSVRKEACIEMLRTRRPGLLGVQECHSVQRDDILAGMPQFKYIGVAVNGVPDNYPTTSANLIFYDTEVFELLENGSFWYSFEPDTPGSFTWFAKKPRNATWGIFLHKPTGRRLCYINNHLQNGVDAVFNRAMSLYDLLGRMRSINPEGLPMFYSGDLNSPNVCEYYSPLCQEMHEAAESCPITDMKGTFGGYKNKDPKPDKRIDHIFYSGAVEGLAYAVDREGYAGIEHISDHFPIYVDFRFTDAAPEKTETYWYDLEPEEGDVHIQLATWNLWNSYERAEFPTRSWQNVRKQVAQDIVSLKADIMGVQELTAPMVSDLPGLLKKAGGKHLKTWFFFSDPNSADPAREAIGFIYDASRFKISNQNMAWISAEPTEATRPWGDPYSAILAAVFTEKASGKQLFVMTFKQPNGERAVKYSGQMIKKIEKEFNPKGLPSAMLVDMNCNCREQIYLSLLNAWCDTYTMQKAPRDTDMATLVTKEPPVVNSKTAWFSKQNLVCLKNIVQHRVIFLNNRVVRDLAPTPSEQPSDHYPVISEIVLKK